VTEELLATQNDEPAGDPRFPLGRACRVVSQRRKLYCSESGELIQVSFFAGDAPTSQPPLHKGDRVIVTGRVETWVYTPTKGQSAGQEVRKLEVVVDEVGPSLRSAEADVQRVAGQGSDETAVAEEAPF
jgi:single-stranded DNA-binding protein